MYFSDNLLSDVKNDRRGREKKRTTSVPPIACNTIIQVSITPIYRSKITVCPHAGFRIQYRAPQTPGVADLYRVEESRVIKV